MAASSFRHFFTSSFKQLLLFIFKCFCFLIIVLCFFNHILPQYAGTYNAGLLDKMERLRSIKGPKIVLLGDSNLSFGIDSSIIEQELGMPVVNMGMYGMIGNSFHEEMARLNVTKGDIYIISHWRFDGEDAIQDSNGLLAWITIENHFHLWRLFRIKDIFPMLKGVPAYLSRSLKLYSSQKGNNDDKSIYSRSSFNKYGDIRLHDDKHIKNPGSLSVPHINYKAIARINKLYSYLSSRGASLLVTPSPRISNSLQDNALVWNLYTAELQKKLNCPVISSWTNYMYERFYFYDTPFHLTSKGAILRSKQLAYDIKCWKNKAWQYSDLNGISVIDNIKDHNLASTREFGPYLDMLIADKERYWIMIAVNQGSSFCLNDDIVGKLCALGINNLSNHTLGTNYYCTINSGIVQELALEYKIQASGFIDHYNHYELTLSGDNAADTNKIIINDNEISDIQSGINIVVYRKYDQRIIDRVCFAAHDQKLAAFRNF